MTDGGKPQLSQTLGKLPGEDKTDVGSLDIFKRIRLFFVFISFIFYLFIFYDRRQDILNILCFIIVAKHIMYSLCSHIWEKNN